MPRNTERQVDGKAEASAEDVLHDVTGVSADSDHFAVRHVNDAHQAKRDRETQRNDQKN